jgi:DHA1 family bicyclomycin/chloramphenicol resistance-like MFS transporter
MRSDIYMMYDTNQQFFIILVAGSLGFLFPLTDMIYLPGFAYMKKDFETDQEMMALTLGVYMGGVALGQLIWASFSDRFGRLPVISTALMCFIIITVSCGLADSVDTLIVERLVQGITVACFVITATTLIADVFDESSRGTAMGLTYCPIAVGPTFAPVIGGILIKAASWRYDE